MTYPNLYVVFYRPRYGNYQHWALYLQASSQQTIFEVSGEHPNFEKHQSHGDPQITSDYLDKVFVGVISDNDISTVCNCIAGAKVDNETIEWDCQEYVIDILDALQEEFVLDEDDEEYQNARKELRKRRGAMD